MVNDYTPPPGKDWVYVGTCACRGADADHVANDEEWELVDVDE